MDIQKILLSNDKEKILALFHFKCSEPNDLILLKFNLWCRKFFPKYFKADDAFFHKEIDEGNLNVYKAQLLYFVDVAFRGAAKTARTKLFVCFVILNDVEHFCKYFKVLCEDKDNSKQIATDIYNMMVNEELVKFYPDTFEKGTAKREETMESFTTSFGVKLVADTVGTAQRGSLQEDARPDFQWFDDFETRVTLYSAKKTRMIWANMEEARTGSAKGRGCVYTCNYISEQGNVHTLVTKTSSGKKVLIIPIIKDGVPTWNYYTVADINKMREDDEDFEGERLCKPSASKDIIFDRETLDNHPTLIPIRTVADLKIFKPYDASHRYALGADVSGGVGLDSSTSVIIDFETIPCRVVATYKSNLVKPDTFGYELQRHGDVFGSCLVAPEQNNHGHATIAILKTLGYENIYGKEDKDTKKDDPTARPKEFGWNTNAATKPKMLFALKKAVEDGLLQLSDPDLVAECKSYSRNDLMDTENDPRLTTRHFDLLIACAIAWQMKDFAEVAKKKEEEIKFEEEKPQFEAIGI